MKLVFFFFLLMVALNAKDLSTCYSIQLLSLPASQSHSSLNVPSNCQKITINKTTTVRCGCYIDFDESKKHLSTFKNSYPKAIIVITYQYRFAEKKLELKPLIEEPIIIKPKSVKLPLIAPIREKQTFDFVLQTDNFKKETQELLQMMLKKNNTNYNTLIADQSNFFGLYMYGKYGQYINQNYFMRDYTDYEYDLKVKFEFFKNGFFEHKKEKQVQLKTSNLVYFKNLSSILKNQFKNQLTTFSALTSEITLHYYTQLSKLYKKAIEERELSLSTIYEVDMLHQMHHRFTQSAKIYERHDRAVFTPLIYSILQKIEYLQLEDIETIKRYAKDYNPDLYLQEAEMEILDIPKSYTDNVSLNLFANRRTVDELGWYNTLGVEATLPLDFSSYEKQELARLEKKALSIAHTSLQQSIDISLDRLYLAFEDLQSYITIDKDDVHYLDTRIQKFKAIKDNTIPDLNFNPDEKILLSSKKIIDLKFDILLKRVELFKILSEIANIANITDITYLIKNKSLL